MRDDKETEWVEERQTSPSLLPVSRFQVVLNRSGARLLSSPMLNLRNPGYFFQLLAGWSARENDIWWHMLGAELTKPSLMFHLSKIYSSLRSYSTASSPFQLGGSPELNSFGSGVAETLRTGRRTTGTTVSGIFPTRNLAGFFASQRFSIGRHCFYSGF